MKDWRGTEIEVGDTILYAVKQSCNVDVNEAIVLEVGEKPIYVYPEIGLVGPIGPYAKVHWLRSNGGEWARKERMVFNVTLHGLENITVIAKGTVKENGNTVN